MKTTAQTVIDGQKGEQLFASFLDKEEIAYVHISQSPETLASVFQRKLKRPDFLLLLPQIGFISIDVKHCDLYQKEFTLSIESEIAPAAEFENLTRLYLWYAFQNKSDPSDDNWYFISAYGAMENGNKRTNRLDKTNFIAINMKHFRKINQAKDFKKLFNARIGTVGQIGRMIEYNFRSLN